eukprot:TRINITY_DN3986_c0_g1_i1.p1 TRINITY_DN3986_c0_g1~~TRINITY_DN3986_c0_g1_i1.p1  ORF type:complete len:230 (-),score=91.05 TRINITY_DN3986_c0_g1_i1:266-907(-)
MDDWDEEEDFAVNPVGKGVARGQAANWDDDEEEDSEDEVPVQQAKKKAPVKAAAKKATKAAAKKAAPAPTQAKKAAAPPQQEKAAPAPVVEDKQLKKDLQLKADLDAAVDLFSGATVPTSDDLNEFRPTTEAEFLEFSRRVNKKLLPYTKSPHYVKLVNDLVKQLVAPLRVDEISALEKSLSAIQTEKQKTVSTPQVKDTTKKSRVEEYDDFI